MHLFSHRGTFGCSMKEGELFHMEPMNKEDASVSWLPGNHY